MKQAGWRLVVKKSLDRVVAAAGLAVAAPVMGATALAIRVTMGSPVFFQQKRPGYRGQPFYVYKFRTMKDARDRDGNLLPDAERLTAAGKFVRATSLDELPQLWNVLKGELSLVGPRPLLMQYLNRYSPEQARRHDVLPGITGWAQIHGRNTVAWEERFRLDVWYVDHWSLRLDCEILAKTLRAVIRREGINQEGHATMSEFLGNAAAQGSRASGEEGRPAAARTSAAG